MEIIMFVGLLASIGYVSTMGAVLASSIWSILALHALVIALGILIVRFAQRIQETLPQVDFILSVTFAAFIISAHFG